MNYRCQKASDFFSIEKLLCPSRSENLDAVSKKPKTKPRRRSSFSALQVHWLENEFRCHRYVSPERRAGLAALLGLTQQQIKIWFQNRRYKTKFRQNALTALDSTDNSPPQTNHPEKLTHTPLFPLNDNFVQLLQQQQHNWQRLLTLQQKSESSSPKPVDSDQ